MPDAENNPSFSFMNNMSNTEIGLGINESSDTWEVIIKFNGDIERVGAELNAVVEVLNPNYAILTLPREAILRLYTYPEVEYVELPKTLTLGITESLYNSCIPPVQSENSFNLKGSGTVVAVVDSGIDYRLNSFRKEDGSTRILFLWDQTQAGSPPQGFAYGTEYTEQQINEALRSDIPLNIVPETDEIGHGTAVAAIAAGSVVQGGEERGIATDSSLIIVKLGEENRKSFTRTTDLMRALKYCISKSKELQMPVSVNISYGTNNASHDGRSLFETYIDDMAEQWKTVIVVATGNEGAGGHHYSNTIKQGEVLQVNFAVSDNISSMYMTLWKNFVDTFSVELVAPSGVTSGIIPYNILTTVMHVDNTTVFIAYGQPNHYNEDQEIYFQFGTNEGYVKPGLWSLKITGSIITNGKFDIWLPTNEEVSNQTAFSSPATNVTLTIPSTAQSVISVGGYNARSNASVTFSGRGYTRSNIAVKPDIVAPAADITVPMPGGGTDSLSGTSLAAPFVTGSAALMMEWGIVKRHDLFLYGQRVKAFLQKGANRSDTQAYPNPVWGYGRICLEETMKLLVTYTQGGQNA